MQNKRKQKIKHIITDLTLAVAGIISASIGLKAFLLPNHFLDGGATGISLLINHLTGFDISILIVLINLPFVFLGYKVVSKRFAIKSFFTIIALAIVVHYIHIPALTDDKLLIAFFGGLFLGAGIGFSVRGGTVIDGTEVLAIFLSKKIRTTIGVIILIFNIILFVIVALLINIEIALYSILAYVTASKSADYIIHGIEEYIGLTIISEKSEEIRSTLTEQLGYGVTIYNGKRGFSKRYKAGEDIDIIHTVVTRLELNKLHTVVDNIDPDAFIIEYPINDAKGGVINKKELH